MLYIYNAFTRHVRSTSSAGLSVSRQNSSSQSSPIYTAPAWWGFSTSADRQRVETFLRRAARSGLCIGSMRRLPRNLLTMLMNDCFLKFDVHHVLVELLPLTSDSQHNGNVSNLRKRRHNLTLPQKKGLDIYLLKSLLLDYCTVQRHLGLLISIPAFL